MRGVLLDRPRDRSGDPIITHFDMVTERRVTTFRGVELPQRKIAVPSYEIGPESRKWLRSVLQQMGFEFQVPVVRGGAQEPMYSVTKDGIASSTSAKTFFELTIPAAASGAIEVSPISWWIEFNNASFGQPLLVELLRVTASTGITGTSITPVKYAESVSSATSLTAKHTASAEGTITSTDDVEHHYVAPTGGILVQYPLGREPAAIPGSTRYWRIRVTGSSGVTPSGSFGFIYMGP